LNWSDFFLKAEDLMAIVIISILFSIAVKVFFEAAKDRNRYITILKKEMIILFPIGALMLAYQIYKGGQWNLSQDTYCYIVVFFNLACTLLILSNKFLKFSRNDNNLMAISIGIVFAPAVTVSSFIMLCWQ
jgi:hypothetical protein